MIVDTSALIAVLKLEPEAEQFVQALAAADEPGISAATLFEATMVIDGQNSPALSRSFDAFIRRAGLVVIPFEAEHAAVAREARRQYGRGSGHPAALNFGDCLSYATAFIAGKPLLYKGDDFAQTDIISALD